MGFLFLPAILAEEQFKRGRLELVLPSVINVAPPLYAVYSYSAYLPAKIRTFRDFIRHRSNLGWVLTGDEPPTEPGTL
nr:LysR substrate-binding domain-containing protein [Rhizobium lemnae]